MSALWNLFVQQNFPYELSTQHTSLKEISVFQLYDGKHKSTGKKVSIFLFEKKKQLSENQDHAKYMIKKLKTFRHPAILTYVDSHEDENHIYLVTNPVVPLIQYLDDLRTKSEMYIMWGISTIITAVQFLHHAEYRHNNIFSGAVFVDESGSWRLGEFGYSTSITETYPQRLLFNLQKYIPPKEFVHYAHGSRDQWGLGILMWEVFNGQLPREQLLDSPKKIPSRLKQCYDNLMNKDIDFRKTLDNLYDCCCCDNLFHNALESLSKPGFDKEQNRQAIIVLSNNIDDIINNIATVVILNKLLPLMKQVYDFDPDSGSIFIPLLAKITKHISEQEYQIFVEEFILKLYQSNDRVVRLALLINSENFTCHMSTQNINNVFTCVAQGLLDTNPKIRGETVKTIVHFASKLPPKRVNEEILRSLIHIQSRDPEPLLRTNSTICLGKICHCIDPATRRKVLAPAFLQSLRDPCADVRNAGVQSLGHSNSLYFLEETAKRILPGLVVLTVDTDAAVRKNTFRTLKIFLDKLEKASEMPEAQEELEKDVLKERITKFTFSDWAVSMLSSKFVKQDSKPKELEEATNDKKDNDFSQNDQAVTDNMTENHTDESHIRQPMNHATRVEKSDHDLSKLKKYKSLLENHETEIKIMPQDETKSDWDFSEWTDTFDEAYPVNKEVRLKNGPMKLGTKMTK